MSTLKSKPKGNDVIAKVNVSLIVRRFRELAELEMAKLGQLSGSGRRDAEAVVEAGLAAGRAQAYRDAAAIMEVVEDNILDARAKS